jgi:hypothetical protein
MQDLKKLNKDAYLNLCYAAIVASDLFKHGHLISYCSNVILNEKIDTSINKFFRYTNYEKL